MFQIKTSGNKSFCLIGTILNDSSHMLLNDVMFFFLFSVGFSFDTIAPSSGRFANWIPTTPRPKGDLMGRRQLSDGVNPSTPGHNNFS